MAGAKFVYSVPRVLENEVNYRWIWPMAATAITIIFITSTVRIQRIRLYGPFVGMLDDDHVDQSVDFVIIAERQLPTDTKRNA